TGPVGGATGAVEGTLGVASASRVRGTVASTPGKSPIGTPPLISTWTGVTPGTEVTVLTTWSSRARVVSVAVPCMKLAPRSTTATVPFIVTLRARVPGGT